MAEDSLGQKSRPEKESTISQKEKRRIYNQEYRAKNKDVLVVASQRYYQKNRDAIIATNIKKYRDNPEPRRKRSREWHENKGMIHTGLLEA